MKQIVGWISLSLMAMLSSTGCNDAHGTAKGETGTLSLPLITHGPSGTTYRLENATFEIVPYQYYYAGYQGAGGAGSIAPGTYATYPSTSTVTAPSTSTAPGKVIIATVDNNSNEESLQVDLEQGNYYVRLVPGWQLTKLENQTSTPVEAQLLHGETQWTWISPHGTSYVEYEFGLGERSLWFNGKLNVNVIVHESPDEVYSGTGGSTGIGSTAIGTGPIPPGTYYVGTTFRNVPAGGGASGYSQ